MMDEKTFEMSQTQMPNQNSYSMSDSQPKIIVTNGGVTNQYNLDALNQSVVDSRVSVEAIASHQG